MGNSFLLVFAGKARRAGKRAEQTRCGVAPCFQLALGWKVAPGCGDWPWGDLGWETVSPPAGPEGVSWVSCVDQGLVSLPTKGMFSGTLLAISRS